MFLSPPTTGYNTLHHLRFDSDSPGCVYVKEKSGSTEVKRNILKAEDWSPRSDELPPLLTPTGLTLQR